MRIAVISDLHGNLAALEAVLADLERVRPDMVVQGGDLAVGGPHPAAVVDRVRECGWPGVLGNTDAMLDQVLTIPEHERRFVGRSAARSREMLGAERISWLTSRPMAWRGDGVALVHATPDDCWAVVRHDASDQILRETYGQLGAPCVVYGHIHHAYLRILDGLTVVNCGSISLSRDSDVRATYVVIEEGCVEHRRVAYDVESVAAELLAINYPDAETYATWLRTGAWPTPPRPSQ